MLRCAHVLHNVFKNLYLDCQRALNILDNSDNKFCRSSDDFIKRRLKVGIPLCALLFLLNGKVSFKVVLGKDYLI